VVARLLCKSLFFLQKRKASGKEKNPFSKKQEVTGSKTSLFFLLKEKLRHPQKKK